MELSEILALPMVFLVDSLHKGSIVFIIVFFILPFVLAYSVGESRSEKTRSSLLWLLPWVVTVINWFARGTNGLGFVLDIFGIISLSLIGSLIVRFIYKYSGKNLNTAFVIVIIVLVTYASDTAAPVGK
ncbi:MAG TPA: hypothetical protein DCF43_10395 [Pseudomonas sp.]|jgi:uncharacterized membrane protein YcaP (DUF421 family)|nr:hypothetical protein [Pseudomonas sp.]